MPSLRDHLDRTPAVRARDLSGWMAPALGPREHQMAPRFFEEAALTVLAHVFRESGPLREALLYERRRFERLAHIIHRLPERGGDA